MKATIHQPNYIPWIGYFHKVCRADVFVILDSVQYEKNGFTNRNKIRVSNSPEGWAWLTVPVKKSSSTQLIKDTEIDNSQKWREKSRKTVELAYKKSPHFEEYRPLLDDMFGREWNNLCAMNIHLIKEIMKALSIDTKVVLASEMGITSKKSDLILDICRQAGCDTYLSGPSGKGYLELDRFKDAGIAVEFHHFEHPTYKQVSEPFVPNMTILDLLFNLGPGGEAVVKRGQAASSRSRK